MLSCALPASAIQAITTVSTSPKLNNAQGFLTTSAVGGAGPFGNAAEIWGVTFTGNDDDIDTVTLGTDVYEFVTLADELRLRRVDNASVTGVRDLVFCRGDPDEPDDEVPCNGSTFTDMETILLGRSLNYGTDNIFTNVGANSNNIERIDYIYKTGITISDAIASDIGFVVLERGGNDAFKIGAILAVDANFNPTSFGTLLSVNNGSHWGPTGFNYESVVFRRDPADIEYRPSSDLGGQNIEGTFITFADLGLVTNDEFFGYALFADDVNNGDNLLLLDNFSKTSNTGLDLVEGGGFFQLVGGAEFVDMRLTKTATTPVISPGAEAIFTVVIKNITQNREVLNADFTDVLPADFANIRWTCQASGVGSTCLNGAVADNGVASTEQGPIVGNAITDELDIGIGGSITYVIRATLSGTASGLISNTASVDPDAGQTEISSSNNSGTATITVQAPATGDKRLYLLTDNNDVRRELSRVPGDDNGDREDVNDGDPETWVTDPDIVGTVTVTGDLGLYVAVRRRGGGGDTRTIDFVLTRNPLVGPNEVIATATTTFNFPNGNQTELLMPTVTMVASLPFDLDPGDQLELEIAPTAGDIRIYERRSSLQADISRIEIPTSTVISVDSITFAPTAPVRGGNVTITAVVSDPFGQEDIVFAPTFDWFNPDGGLVLNNQAMSEIADGQADTKTFTFTYTIPDAVTSNGDWRATVTAIEGFEVDPIDVTHTASEIVTVGAVLPPVLTLTKLVDGFASINLDSGAFPEYEITVENIGTGPATSVVVTLDVGNFVSFGVDSQSGGVPFTFIDDIGGLPTNFMGTPQVSINNGPYQAVPASPSYNPNVTGVRVQMNGTMDPGEKFRLIYAGELE
jgi:uncharacterized repeat protein (TIGR01451 family)